MKTKLKYYKLNIDCFDGAIEYIDTVKEINKSNYMMYEVIENKQKELNQLKENFI